MGDRPQGNNAELKSTITIRKTSNDNNNDNTPFKVVCPQSLLHRKQTQVIFKHKTQTTRTLTEEKHTKQATKTNK